MKVHFQIKQKFVIFQFLQWHGRLLFLTLLNVEMLENAATVIFRMTQKKSFLEEVKH